MLATYENEVGVFPPQKTRTKECMKKQGDDIPPGYTRVTEALNAYANFDGVPPAVLAHAAERGERIHRYCELYSRSLLIEEPDEDCKPYVDSYMRWFDYSVACVIHLETRINCKKYKLSGKPDMLAILKGDTEPTIVDWKSPQTKATSWELQTAAYRILYREELNINVHRRMCLSLDNEGGRARVSEHTKHDLHERLFLNSYELHLFFKG
jgi:hypothetical protein